MTSLSCVKECTVSNQLLVKQLLVSAGDNLLITFPENGLELKAFVVPSPPAGESVTFLCDPRGPLAGLFLMVFVGSLQQDSFSQHCVRSRLKVGEWW